MVKSDADLPYINQVLVAHGANNIVYRKGPARKVQVVIPSAPLPSPQSAVIRTLRPLLRRLNASLNLGARRGQGESGDSKVDWAATNAEDAKTGHTEDGISSDVEHGAERRFQCQMRVGRGIHRYRKSLQAAKLHVGIV